VAAAATASDEISLPTAAPVVPKNDAPDAREATDQNASAQGAAAVVAAGGPESPAAADSDNAVKEVSNGDGSNSAFGHVF
jgi:hypothetical protein